jgi:hypothetical protein
MRARREFDAQRALEASAALTVSSPNSQTEAVNPDSAKLSPEGVVADKHDRDDADRCALAPGPEDGLIRTAPSAGS